MAFNFKISMHRNSDNLHMQLMGDFDCSSACELINRLKENNKGVRKVFIHTNGLEHVHSYDKDIFQREGYVIDNQFIEILLTGENARQIAIQGARILS